MNDSVNTAPLHLASASPRRADILRSLGLTFTAGGVSLDETPGQNESPEALVERLARGKALAATNRGLVLGADTVVALDGRILGKPSSQADCLCMLATLSGQTHRVLTGVALRSSAGVDVAVSTTEVTFREIRPDEALAYWHSGEPRDKAGAYAIQGLGSVFVEAIVGSYSGVVGLPIFETTQMLARAGIEVLDVRENHSDRSQRQKENQ